MYVVRVVIIAIKLDASMVLKEINFLVQVFHM